MGFQPPIVDHVPDAAGWPQYSPIALAARSPQWPATLIAGNVDDLFFFEGGRVLGQNAVQAGGPGTWIQWAGEHCDIDASVLADWLK